MLQTIKSHITFMMVKYITDMLQQSCCRTQFCESSAIYGNRLIYLLPDCKSKNLVDDKAYLEGTTPLFPFLPSPPPCSQGELFKMTEQENGPHEYRTVFLLLRATQNQLINCVSLALCSLVIVHLDNCVQFWAPQYKREMEIVGRV